MEQGIIQVYTGDGKGKTTAAMGQALRAYGRGLRVAVFQLLKAPGGTGEEQGFAALNPKLSFLALGNGQFIIGRAPTGAEIEQAEQGWARIQAAMASGLYDLIVIDELSHTVNMGLLKPNQVKADLQAKPANLELVLTGSQMPEAILGIADLVTEMRMIKHPFQKGLDARQGIEY